MSSASPRECLGLPQILTFKDPNIYSNGLDPKGSFKERVNWEGGELDKPGGIVASFYDDLAAPQEEAS
jgi:hypothetical protein